MQKINTLYLRDAANPKLVTREVDPDCKWVIDSYGIATEKIDGSCCAILDGIFYRRHAHDAQKGEPPAGWVHWSRNDAQRSGHGWLPVSEAPADRWHREAFSAAIGRADGTYELIGPRVQSNPYGLKVHCLMRHGSRVIEGFPRDHDSIWSWFAANEPIEGVVWHHPDGRMAKIKRRDFGLPWPVKS